MNCPNDIEDVHHRGPKRTGTNTLEPDDRRSCVPSAAASASNNLTNSGTSTSDRSSWAHAFEVGVRRVDGADDVQRYANLAFIGVEGLKGARGEHSTEVKQNRRDRHCPLTLPERERLANTPIRFKMGSAWLTHHMTSHVVVDGSNIATEGHKTPRLGQLVEAVEQFLTDRPHDRVTVICDASFPNRIEESERKQYESFLEDGWLITPPAGAIGRGDAFILQVAAKVNAAVLSNDSFQEFHGEHSWLFDDGRLVGGKPVPGVGWIFVDRLPVRGPTSRKAVRDADRAASGSDSTTEVAPADVVKPKARRVRKSPAKASTPKKAAKKVGNKAATSATKDTAAKPVTASDGKAQSPQAGSCEVTDTGHQDQSQGSRPQPPRLQTMQKPSPPSSPPILWAPRFWPKSRRSPVMGPTHLSVMFAASYL